MDYKRLNEIALDSFFSYTAPLNTDTIELMKQEVLDMCAQSCQQYAKHWSCPPRCGFLEELHKNIDFYNQGILVQTVTELEDEFDWDGMMKAQSLHQEHFLRFLEKLHAYQFSFLPLGTGCCIICKTCTYPYAPCRFPQKKNFFHGSIRYVGIRNMSEKPAQILLWF